MTSARPSDALPTAAEILAKFYAAETAYMASTPETRDFASGMGACLSPNFICYQSPDLPWGGKWHGREGLRRWSEIMAGYFDTLEVLEPKVYEQSDAGGEGDSVLVESMLRVVPEGKEGQVEWVRPMVQVVKVDRREGWIESIRPFYWDVKGLREILGV